MSTLPAHSWRSNCSGRPVGVAEVELSEVPDLPTGVGVILAGHVDQVRVEVHADDLVACAGEMSAQSSCAAAGVEDPGRSRGHGVDQPGLAVDVLPGRLDPSPSLGVAARVLGIAPHRLGPQAEVHVGLQHGE